jgi:hypothetical protein
MEPDCAPLQYLRLVNQASSNSSIVQLDNTSNRFIRQIPDCRNSTAFVLRPELGSTPLRLDRFTRAPIRAGLTNPVTGVAPELRVLGHRIETGGLVIEQIVIAAAVQQRESGAIQSKSIDVSAAGRRGCRWLGGEYRIVFLSNAK